VSGSPDGRWAVGDDFSRSIYLIDRHTSEMMLSRPDINHGCRSSASDDEPDGTRIEIQSADAVGGRPFDEHLHNSRFLEAWLKRK
jgi:oligogalacturonide lyase